MPPGRGSTMCCVRHVGQNEVHNVRLVQGSHIVVRKKFDDPRAYFFQNPDGRIIFAIPYEDEFTLIGTTDRTIPAIRRMCRSPRSEIDYLCNAASEYFDEPVERDDIVWTYSAVRPLYRRRRVQGAGGDARLCAEGWRGGDGAPARSMSSAARSPPIAGCRSMRWRRSARLIGTKGKPWTAEAPLPGGDFPATGYRGGGRPS